MGEISKGSGISSIRGGDFELGANGISAVASSDIVVEDITPILLMPLEDSLELVLGTGTTTITRSTTGTFKDKDDGLIKTAAINAVRFESNGLLLEGISTNEALHNRDYANAAHVKTNITALKDAIGADGVANASSTLTATAANGTVFQTVTKASAENTFSIDIRRKTGTGTIEISDDGGSTFTDITSLINSTTYTRHQITTTQANPSFGVRIVSSGDEVETDYGQLEVLPFASSRIETTTTPIQRTLELLTLPSSSNFNESEGSLFFKTDIIGDTGATQHLVQIDSDTNSNRHILFVGSDKLQTLVNKESVTQALYADPDNFTVNQLFNITYTYKENEFKTFKDSVLIGSDSAGTPPTGLITMRLGAEFATMNFFGHIKSLRIYDVVLTPEQVAAL